MCLGSHKAMVPCYLKSSWGLGGDNEGSSALLLAAGGALHRADVPDGDVARLCLVAAACLPSPPLQRQRGDSYM